jgi:hypothetical protein
MGLSGSQVQKSDPEEKTDDQGGKLGAEGGSPTKVEKERRLPFTTSCLMERITEMGLDFPLKNDPGLDLQKEALALLNRGKRYDKHGQRLDLKLGYSEAFVIACKQNPELTRKYIDQIRPKRRP